MNALSFEAIGTHWTINLEKTNPFLEKQLFLIIKNFDLTYSRFSEDSYFSQISKTPGCYKAPHDFSELKKIYEKLYKLTDGLFTPLIGTLLTEAGYDKDYSLKPKKLSPVADLYNCVKFGKNSVEIISPVILDFGAAGKGYLVDQLTSFFRKENIDNFIIDAGGDIYINATHPIRIGLEHPDDTTKAIGVCEINKLSICSSSGNRRKWENFHHIFNPKTLKPSDEVLATWVVSSKAIEADALATALFLLPNPSKFKCFKFEYVILYKDYKASISKNFPGQIFSK